jgi:energy-coupling factor transporter transmembrane protein EcfT
MRLLYQFSAGESFLHRLDARTKLVLIFCMLVATFISPVPWAMPFIPVLVLWALGRIPPWQYWAFLVLMLPLMIAITLIQALSGGPPYISVGPIPISEPGLATGLVVAFRLAAMGIAFMMFSATTDPFDWGLSMYRSGVPYRVAFMFAFAMRFFPLLQEELLVIRNALAARGSDVFSLRNPFRFLRGVAMSVVPLGLGALRRSQDIALAMELRGFGYAEEAGIRRSLFRDVRLRRNDYVVGGLSVLFVVAVIAHAAQAGSLPILTRGQRIFGALLIALLAIVGVAIIRAVGGPHRPRRAEGR